MEKKNFFFQVIKWVKMWDEKCGSFTKKHVYTKTPRYHIDYIKKQYFKKYICNMHQNAYVVVILTQMDFEVWIFPLKISLSFGTSELSTKILTKSNYLQMFTLYQNHKMKFKLFFVCLLTLILIMVITMMLKKKTKLSRQVSLKFLSLIDFGGDHCQKNVM